MLPIFKDDPHLCSHESNIMHRINAFRGWKEQFRKNEGGVDQFAEGYKTFGFQRHESEQKWTFTEWLPEARSVFLIGDFNNWENTHPLKPGEFGRWSIDLPDKRDGKWAVPHRSQFRLRIQSDHGSVDRVPAWTKLACKNREIGVFNGIMWEPPPSERYVMRHARPPRPANLKIYEAHLGIAGTEERIHTYLDFKDILPRIKRLGYNALQIMAVAEHANASSFGYQVTSYFAPSSRFGTPDELKELVDTAHAYGLTVLMDLVHSHCSSNQVDGIAAMDGTDHCYTERHGGHKGKQDQWHASLFDYGKYEVLRFLLSNIRWWIEEYGFDGFRFGGVTSMLYISHGIGKHFGHDYHQYFGMDADTESGTYMMLANYLVKRLLPRSGLTIAEDFSSMPTLCRPVDDGGFGFDYNLSVNIPPMWTKLLQDQPDETWSVSRVVKNLQKRRFKEPCIAFAESHDQAKVGAKTLASSLMDAEMYAHMSIAGPESMVIERGLALHKMIRLVCMGLGGEGYLNFMGNEFAHPDFVDLPSDANGWSLQNAIRRFDLPQDEDLKYKFFEAFDEAMLALENRFKFMASPRYFCSRKDDSDKVVIFEHGDCLFVFNFHPKRSYTEYRVGHSWNENMRVVLDSDEPCFGGQDRLASAHETSFPPLDGWDSRYHSAEMFLPSRTVQVLVRESLLEGGVTVCLGTGPTSAWPFPAGELLLAPVDGDGGVSQVMNFTVSEGRLSVKLPGPTAFEVYWEVQKGGVTRGSGAPNPNATKVKLPFALDTYRVYFPGTYILDHLGNLKCESDAAEQGDGVPQGCKDVPSCVSRPQYVRAKSQNFLAPSEMPEEPLLEAASHNLPDTWVDVESPKPKRERCKKESSKKAEAASEKVAADPLPQSAFVPDKSEVEAEPLAEPPAEHTDLPQDDVQEAPAMDAPMDPPVDAPVDAPVEVSDAAPVPQGSDETVPPDGPQYEWAKPNFMAPPETPEEPLLEAASHNIPDTWVDVEVSKPKRDRGKQAPKRHSKKDACDFLAMLPDQPLAAGVVKMQPLSDLPQLPGRLPARKGSMSLLPESNAEASSLAADAQDDKSSRSQSRRRRRRSNKDRSTGRSWQPKADQAKGEEEDEDFKPPALQEADLAWLQGVRKVPLQQAARIKALEKEQAAVRTALAEAQAARMQREAEEEPPTLNYSGRKGSLSLLPDLPVKHGRTEAGRTEDYTTPTSGTQTPRTKVSSLGAESSQDGKSSRSQSRRRRRRSNKDRSTGRSWQPKEIQDEQLQAEAARMQAMEEAERAKAEKEAAAAAAAEAQAARIQALEEEQAAVRRALAEAQAARMQREAEEAEMRRQQEQQAAALQAAKMKAIQEQAARWHQERAQEEQGTLLMQAQRKGSMSLLPEPEAEKSQPLQTSPQAVVSKGRARQVAQPKFARGAPQARSSKSLPPRKEASTEGSESAGGSINYTRQAQQVQARLMEEPPMLNYSGRQGSLSLLPDLPVKPERQEVGAAWPDKMEAEHTDLPQDDVQEASNLSLQDWAEGHHYGEKDSRKEGHTTPTSGTQTPRTKALSEPNSDSGPETMERVFSLSALDSLLQDPEGKADLRHQLELDELEDRRPKYTSRHLNRPVVVVSSEVNPWSKTGGLAMVAGSYGYEFAMRGHRTMVVSPRYAAYDGAHYVGYAKVWLDGREHEVQFFHLYQDLGDGNGTDYIFVGHDCFMRGGLYCDPHSGKEYLDNLFRFSLLTVAALEAPLILNIRGHTFGQDVLFIANDWQTGLLPVYHLYKYRRNNTYRNSRCVFVIHNIGYQGKYRLTKFPIDSYLGLPPDAIDFLQGEDLNLGNDCMNLMSAAILASDRVLTVSPNYAAEIQSPEGGQGLHEILQQKGHQQRMAGILNGIADEWNPKTDPHIPTNYSLRNFDEGKALCKKELQRSLGLHEDPGAALIGFCGRLCYQKGVHLITQIIPWLLTYESSGVLGRVQVILMGKGEDTYANQLSNAENHNKGRVCGYVGFDPKIEHRMLAGCDFLMMPSQYEPCGLPQMYAQAYGTVPVVHETGGLKDSVSGLWDEHRDRETATGFLFCGFDENHLKERMYQALEVFHKKQDLFRQIQMNGLRKNYYWPQAIDEYERQLDWTFDSDAAVS